MDVAERKLTVRSLVEEGLVQARSAAAREGIEAPPPRGKLLRPRAGLAFAAPELRRRPPPRFWLGCLAVQMAHEASLHHDDVLDAGVERRGASSTLGAEGAGAALLAGDLRLAQSYRVALATRSDRFVAAFAEAVESTVRGEAMQRETSARGGTVDEYESVVRAKSGSLFGAAAGAALWLTEGGGAESTLELGIDLGAFYQLVDDFLDYCPSEDTGKPKLQDFRNRVWTSALGDRGVQWFDQPPEAALRAFFLPRGGGAPSMATDAIRRLRARASRLSRGLAEAGADDELIRVVEGWTRRCARAGGRAVERISAASNGEGDPRPARRSPASFATAGAAAEAKLVKLRAQALGPRERWGRFFARHSRSFSFAAKLFSADERRRVREIYAWCRFTDDLVDEASASGDRLHRVLDAWTSICRAARAGVETGVPLADAVMREMARRDVPFALAREIVEGVRMDVEPRAYRTWDDLGLYTHRVASVVGEWMTRSFGVRDDWTLRRARSLGHAMQLTNIVRDVGEDLRRGRIYLPRDRMAAHGVEPASLEDRTSRAADGRGPGPAYADLMEEVMAVADAAYADAYEAMPRLPASCQRAVAVAAEVYRGIHGAVRRNGYDNLNRRARTSLPRKVALAGRGYRRLRAQRPDAGRPRTAVVS